VSRWQRQNFGNFFYFLENQNKVSVMRTDWHKRFMDLAHYVADWSKYPGRHVGAVIVDDRHTVVSLGYNGCARGCNDDDPNKYLPTTKYLHACHAEENAVLNAARSLLGCTLYVMWFPCATCARIIIQAGIKRIVVRRPNFQDPDWGENFKAALQMFKETKMEIVWYGERSPTVLYGDYEGYGCVGDAKRCLETDCAGCVDLRLLADLE
jgi:dCMP deaminase